MPKESPTKQPKETPTQQIHLDPELWAEFENACSFLMVDPDIVLECHVKAFILMWKTLC
jgi:hypothetical protein